MAIATNPGTMNPNGLGSLIRSASVNIPQLFRRTEERTKLNHDVALFGVNDSEVILDLFPVSGPHSQLYSQLHLSREYPLVEELQMKLRGQMGKFDGTFILSQPGILNPFGDYLAGLEGHIEAGNEVYLARFNADSVPVPWGSNPYMYLIEIRREVPR